MKIEKNKVVSLTYELRLDNPEGDFIEKADKTQPLVFLYGAGSMLPAFEENLSDKSSGDDFSFTLQSKDAYGEFTEEAVMELPITLFMKEGKVDQELVQVGNMIPMRDQEGQVFQGKVMKVGLEAVKMDFNHPLAGQNLHFSGNILNVRAATEDELAHGHVHGPGGIQH